MVILGIETSCDETSAAVLVDGDLRSNIISSQFVHAAYGGIVPELASRAHLTSILPVIETAIDESGLGLDDMTHVAATQGPGLVGSLLVGLNTAKAFAVARSIPCLGINHIEAHVISPFLGERHPRFPYLCLVVSGGHTLLLLVKDIGRYLLLGATIDDAAGEAFDKVGKMLGLPFPGGPGIDRAAEKGNPDAIRFPRPLLDSGDYSFSFSGLKTAVLYHLRDTHPEVLSGAKALDDTTRNDLSASFQQALVDALAGKLERAVLEHRVSDIAVVGGVSANRRLKASCHMLAEKHNLRVFIPSTIFSTDNAAMVAMLAYKQIQAGSARYPAKIAAYARLPKDFFS